MCPARSRRGRSWPRRPAPLSELWLIFVLLLVYLVLGVPWVANALAKGVSEYRPVCDQSVLAGAGILVVLHGDNAQGRVREASRLFERIAPPVVVVCGSHKFLEAILDAGIPANRVRHEWMSTTTQEQIATLARWIDGEESRRVVLVASLLHMTRVAALANAQGFHPVLAPSPVDIEPPTSGFWQFVPTYASLMVSRDAIYEYAALASYRRHGWIR